MIHRSIFVAVAAAACVVLSLRLALRRRTMRRHARDTRAQRRALSVRSVGVSSPLCSKYDVALFVVPSNEAWERCAEAREAFGKMEEELQALPVLGVDGEWCKDRPTAVLQVASRSYCFVFQLMGFDCCPAPLRRVLECPHVIKCGVGIRGDAARLRREWGLELCSRCELGNLAAQLAAVPAKARSLAAVTLALTGDVLGKDSGVTTSDWEVVSLSDLQVAYAADDAICAVFCMLELFRCFGSVPAVPLAEAVRQFYDQHKDKLERHPADARAQRGRDAGGHQPSMEQRRLLKIERKEQKHRAASGAGTLTPAGATSQWVLSGTVRVLSRSGQHIFNVDHAKARWYVDKKQLAVVTKRREGEPLGDPCVAGSSKSVVEIQLLFEPKVKTKLCMNWQLGSCPVGAACPFAHGVADFAPSLTSDNAPPSGCEGDDSDDGFDVPNSASLPEAAGRPPRPGCCVICLGTGDLLKHSIVPPAFRKFLPHPFDAGVADDFVAICLQCNPRVRLTYDLERKRLEEAMLSESAFPPLFDVAKVIRYAQILENQATRKDIPQERLEEMRAFISTRAGSFDTASGFRGGTDVRAMAELKVGDVHNAHIVAHAVGSSEERAIAFVKRYRDLFVAHFRPQFVPWQCTVVDTNANARES